jgi:hypothetical protein
MNINNDVLNMLKSIALTRLNVYESFSLNGSSIIHNITRLPQNEIMPVMKNNQSYAEIQNICLLFDSDEECNDSIVIVEVRFFHLINNQLSKMREYQVVKFEREQKCKKRDGLKV